MKSVLCCSDCFRNEGLRLEATSLGVRVASICPNCGLASGRKLNRNHLLKLISRFFVQATVPHGIGGYAPILQYNPDRQSDDVQFDSETASDWALVKRLVGGSLFHYGPPLWRIGFTDHYEEPNVISDDTIDKIVKMLSIKTLPKGFKTFRIRKNVDARSAMNLDQFGVPPTHIERDYGRFDDGNLQILYTSPSIPVCLHECRVLITDDISVATFSAVSELKVADLTADYDQEAKSPFEDLRYFFNGVFLTRDESIYGIARRISAAIKKIHSVDGFITNSFFTTVSQEPVSQNYCFYPETVKQKLSLNSLNRLHLETVSYTYAFGPNFSNFVEEPV
jgi:RES domain